MSNLSGNRPGFPSLTPRLVDPLWHQVDRARNEDAELTRMEQEHEARLKEIARSYIDIPPIGKKNFLMY